MLILDSNKHIQATIDQSLKAIRSDKSKLTGYNHLQLAAFYAEYSNVLSIAV